MKTKLRALLEEKGRQVHAVGPETGVLEAVHKMNEAGIGALLVLVGEKPVGIFSERDVLRRVVGAGLDPATTRVEEVMTGALVAVQADATVEEAMAIVTEKRCRHLPVLAGEELAGLLSSGDLTRWATRSQQFEIQSLVRYIQGKYPG